MGGFVGVNDLAAGQDDLEVLDVVAGKSNSRCVQRVTTCVLSIKQALTLWSLLTLTPNQETADADGATTTACDGHTVRL